MCDQLFYGMKSELKNGIRHLYDSTDITFGELLNKAQKVELEDNEVKGVTKVQAKNAVVGETSLISKLQQQVAQLTTLVKSPRLGLKRITLTKVSTGKVIIKTITVPRKITVMAMQECNPRDLKLDLMVLLNPVNTPYSARNVKGGETLGASVNHG